MEDKNDYVYSWDGKSREIERFDRKFHRHHMGAQDIKGRRIEKSIVKGRNAAYVN